MTNVLRYAMAGWFLCAGTFASRSEAAVAISGTRVVYPAQENDVSIELTNLGTAPALVQLWLDAGDPDSTPDSTQVPFVVTPPVFRLDAGKSQAARLMYSKEPLPTDKETLFWINMIDVPPRAEADIDKNLLQFAIRTRIKLFFRPAGLPGDARSAPQKLTWKLVNGKNGKGVALQASNPTPYYVNFATVGLKVGGRVLPQKKDRGGLVPPGGTETFPISELSGLPASGAQAQVEVIYDSGAVEILAQPLAL